MGLPPTSLKTQKGGWGQRERERERERERKTETETERQTDRETDRQRQTIWGYHQPALKHKNHKLKSKLSEQAVSPQQPS